MLKCYTFIPKLLAINNLDKKIVITDGYLEAPSVVSMISEHDNILLITSDEKLYKFYFNLKKELEVVLIPRLFIYKKRLDKIMKDIVLLLFFKWKLNSIFKIYNINEVFIYTRIHCSLNFWVIRKHYKYANIYIDDRFLNDNYMQNFYSKKSYITIKLYKYIFGVNYKMIACFGHKHLIVTNEFLKMIGVLRKKSVINIEKNFKFVSESFPIFKNADILLLNGGMYNLNIPKYTHLISELINLMGQHLGRNILVKNHPGFESIQIPYFDKQNIIDDYLPINLFLKSFKVVVGIESGVLYEFANNGGHSISLINMCSFLSQEAKKNSTKYLQSKLNASCKIFFPNNFNSLINVLS
jgi:hypothetical protein